MNNYQFLEQKLENFKQFLKEVCKNTETIEEYENMSMTKLLIFVNWFLLPQKNNLESVVEAMNEKLNFADEHKPKIKKYLEMFCEIVQSEEPKNENVRIEITKDKTDVSVPEKKDDETIDEYLKKLEQLNL